MTKNIYINPERRDPGFRENKNDVGLGNVDNISSSELINIITDQTKNIINEKKVGKICEANVNKETFYPLFETTGKSSTCSTEVGFFLKKENNSEKEDKEISSFEFTFSCFNSDSGISLSYSLNVAPNSYPISDYYLRILYNKTTNVVLGGIYCGQLYNPLERFNQVGINLVNWTPGSTALTPDPKDFSEFSQSYKIVQEIPLNHSSNNLGFAAESFVLYDSLGNPQLPKNSYTSEEFNENLDAPTINGVPFLLKKGVRIDNKEDGRHIEISAKHSGPNLDEAGEHNWKVLSHLGKAGLVKTSSGAESKSGEVINDSDLGYGLTRLSKYGNLGSNITLENLNLWMNSFGIDSDVISVGLFKNFIGYISNIIDSSSSYTNYHFSLADSSQEFQYVGSTGSSIEIIFNSYVRVHNSGNYTDEIIKGSGTTLIGYEFSNEDIIHDITFEDIGNYQIKAIITINQTTINEDRSVDITFKQKSGSSETPVTPIKIHIDQEGFITKYGILLIKDGERTPKYDGDVIRVKEESNESFEEFFNISVIKSIPDGYEELSGNISTSILMDDSSESWLTSGITDWVLSFSGNENSEPIKRTASGFVLIYDESYNLLGQVPVLVSQEPVPGYIRIDSDSTLLVNKSGSGDEGFKVLVSSNYPWTILPESVPSWVHFKDFNGSRPASVGGILTVIVYENNQSSSEDRRCNIQLINDSGKIAELKIIQSGKQKYIDILDYPDTDIFVPMARYYGLYKVTILFKTDIPWLVDYKPDWISVSRSSGPSINVTVDENGNREEKLYWELTLSINNQEDISGLIGDYVSLGYFDESTGAIKSLRKIYIDLTTWYNNKLRDYQQEGHRFWENERFGAFLYGPVYKTLNPGDTFEIYSVASILLEEYSTNPGLDIISQDKGVPVINLSSDFEFVGDWTHIDEQESFKKSIYYPELYLFGGYNSYKRVIKAKETFSSITNIESTNCLLDIKYEPNLPGILNRVKYESATDENIVSDSIAKLTLHKVFPSGITVTTSTGGQSHYDGGVIITNSEQDITLRVRPKNNNQAVYNPFLLNSTLPGWLYFDEGLTSLTSIDITESMGESKDYNIHILPNKTLESRSVTLRFCDRGIKDSEISYTITQNPADFEILSKEIISVVPILSEKISDNTERRIRINPLVTYVESIRIGDTTYRRTLREVVTFGNYLFTKQNSELWYNLSNSGSQYYVNITENTEANPRLGIISITFYDGDRNEFSGEIAIVQPSREKSVTYELTNLSSSVIDLGASNNIMPLFSYDLGYKLLADSKKIKYIDEEENEVTIIESSGEIFPESIEDITVESLTNQGFKSEEPLTLTRTGSTGVEEESDVEISIYGYSANLKVYQEKTTTPFELKYSYVQVDPDDTNTLNLNLTVNFGEITFSEDSGEVKFGIEEQSRIRTYLSVPTIMCKDQNPSTETIVESGILKVIYPRRDSSGFTHDYTYQEDYGLSVQKRLTGNVITLETTLTSSERFKTVLTLVPKPITDNIGFSEQDHESQSEFKDTLKTSDLNRSSNLPSITFVNGLSRNSNQVSQGIFEFGKKLGEYQGKRGILSDSAANVSYIGLNGGIFRELNNIRSYFCSSHYPTSIILKDVERTNKSDELFFRIHSKDLGSEQLINFLHFSENMSINSGDGTQDEIVVLLERNQQSYEIDYSGLPFGFKVSNVVFNSELTNIPKRYVECEDYDLYNQNISYQDRIVIKNIKRSGYNETEHGVYDDLTKYGAIKIIPPTGSTPWNNILDSGIKFLVATIKVKFSIGSDSTKREVEKTIKLQYKGKEVNVTLISPPSDNSRILMRSYSSPKDSISNELRFSTWYGSQNYQNFPLSYIISERGCFFIKDILDPQDRIVSYSDYKKEDWIFSTKNYNDSFGPGGNSGYITNPGPMTKNIKLPKLSEGRDYASLASQNKSMEEEIKLLSKFKIMASTSIDFDDSTPGEIVDVSVGPPCPWITITDLNNQGTESVFNGDTLYLDITPPAQTDMLETFVLRANFRINHPYTEEGMIPLNGEYIFDYFKVREFWNISLAEFFISDIQDLSLGYDSITDSYYIEIISFNQQGGSDIILPEGWNDEKTFGEITFGFKDPVLNDSYYELTLNLTLR